MGTYCLRRIRDKALLGKFPLEFLYVIGFAFGKP